MWSLCWDKVINHCITHQSFGKLFIFREKPITRVNLKEKKIVQTFKCISFNRLKGKTLYEKGFSCIYSLLVKQWEFTCGLPVALRKNKRLRFQLTLHGNAGILFTISLPLQVRSECAAPLTADLMTGRLTQGQKLTACAPVTLMASMMASMFK